MSHYYTIELFSLPDFNPYQHFGFLTHRVARLIDLHMAVKLKEWNHHVPTSCIGILADLWKNDGIAQHELGISLIKTKSSITKMLSALENAQLIIKREDSKDKRKKLIHLTIAGKELRSKIEVEGIELENKLLSNIDETDVYRAKKVLNELYINLSKKLIK